MALAPDQYILNGKYRIVKLIGEGGMARVWLAEELTFGGRQVALKEPKAGLREEEAVEVARRFQQEISLTAALMQAGLPRIVPAWTVEPLDSKLLLVMQYMPGGSLADLLNKPEHRAGLPISQAVAIAQDVLEALAGLHGLPPQPVHRDVKPSNILLDAQGRAYLADFGLAQLPGVSGRSRLAAGPHPADPMYAAPEQLRSPEPLVPSADLFAVGCVLWEMLTGKRYKLHKPSTPPSQLRAQVPAWLDEVVMRALAENPWTRWQSAGEMAKALASGARQAPLPKPIPVLSQKRFLKANWLVVFAALMVLAMVIVRVAGSGRSGVGPQTQSSTLDFGSTMVNELDGMEYVWVPPGEFLMGSSDVDWLASSDEQPQHSVYLDGYWIAKTEVTVAQYRRCVEAGACTEPGSSDGCTYNMVGKENHPVNCVSWEQAAAYCEWAGCRLPTEAEWEKAARGTDGRIYPWGNSFDGSKLNFCDINCVYPHRNASANDRYEATAPVGSFPSGASPYGALDMAGNVWEWVADWYDRDFYAQSPAQNPSGPENGAFRVLRGGSWDNTVRLVRSAYRHYGSPDHRYIYIGFRPARSP